ncbi:putative HNHc nuclease [Anaerofustis stercorihominis]|uniref:Uncharacterized protein n=1 Tax=Anaerofustis stercorihominis TaxID=214853 RepID=A0A3E3DW64_9FIRM|nr:putative HNHc nuclease [Anaerofustis stercorihominis]RGD72928.1 hypothetical protein DW687_11855 [Anaerofustis stercorihominis]
MQGKIVKYKDNKLYIIAEYDNPYKFDKCGYRRVNIELLDNRSISKKQRKAIYALLGDIAEYTGYEVEDLKQLMKCWFLADRGGKEFSLSDVDMTTAWYFTDFLIDYCIENNVPCHESLSKYPKDIERYVYKCLLHKICCISGRKCELHHIDAIGMGRNRNEITHIGMRAMPLAPKYHIEVHNIGLKAFEKRYHVCGVKIDERIASVYSQIKK